MQNNRFIYEIVNNNATTGNTITVTNKTSYYTTTLSLFPSTSKGGIYRVTVTTDSTTTNLTVIVPYSNRKYCLEFKACKGIETFVDKYVTYL